MKHPDLIGRKFGKLTVVEKHENSPDTTWLCRCDCGNFCQVRTNPLVCRKFPQKSCGCYRNTVLSIRHAASTKPPGVAALNRLFLRYQANANKSKAEFNLAKDEFRTLVGRTCAYCGASPAQKVHGARDDGFVYNGLDKVNPAAGYTANNVKPCCKTCNIAKHTMSEQEFYSWIKRAWTHLKPVLNDV
jgi:hypothetical protein